MSEIEKVNPEEFNKHWGFQSREELLTRLKTETKVLQDSRLAKTFEAIDRADFVPDDYKVEAYEDYPLPIGHNQTISQPTTVAFMLEKLGVNEGDNVLDLGCGSGWTTALLAHLVGPGGMVFGVELIPELVKFGKKNLAKYKFKHARIGPAEELGLPKKAPFDKILVSASAEEMPQILVDQLSDGGSMVIPIENTIVSLHKKNKKEVKSEVFEGFAFVPLIQ